MDQIQTHPSNAAQAKTFIAPGSLSFPGGAGELTPPSEADKQNGLRNGANGMAHGQVQNGNGVTPATPAATPGATQGPSGIVPTLQYVYPRVSF
jgi:transcription initiation factor TFIID TATA-box-binding protein